MTRLPPSPFISVSPGDACSPLPSGEVVPSVTLAYSPGESLSATPLAAPCDVSVTTAGAAAPSSAPAVSNSDSVASFPAQDDAPNSAGADLQIPAPAAFSNSESAASPPAWLDAPDAAGVGVATAAPAAFSDSSSCGGVDGHAGRQTQVGLGITLDASQRISDAIEPVREQPLTNQVGINSGPHDSISDTQYIPELFSDYAHRRSMPVISPPLPKVEREIALDFQSLFKKIKEKDDVGDFDDPPVYPLPVCLDHPRDLDLDPPPIFQRKPRPAFLRALLQLGAPQ